MLSAIQISAEHIFSPMLSFEFSLIIIGNLRRDYKISCLLKRSEVDVLGRQANTYARIVARTTKLYCGFEIVLIIVSFEDIRHLSTGHRTAWAFLRSLTQ